MIVPIISATVALLSGFLIGQLSSKNKATKIEKEAVENAQKMIKSAKDKVENIKNAKVLEAKEHFLKKKESFDNYTKEIKKKTSQRENDLKNRQKSLQQKNEHVNRKEKDLDGRLAQIDKQKTILDKKIDAADNQISQYQSKLEELTGLSREEAKENLIQSLKKEADTNAMAYIKKTLDEAKATANKEAKKIIIQTIQRTAAEHTIENCVSVFNLDSDDQKGQIIGREGRNIRALESATGCEIIVDDTPEAIIISGYDPVRREITRLSLQRLVADGRIHPARVEEVVAKTRKQIEEHIREIGERTVIELNIQGLHPELVRYVGRMRFRSSYGQNLLQHSKETARLCATMAAELGLNPKLAKRAGLLHDIGKVAEDETDLSHALFGMKLCEKHGEHPSVCNAVGAHHDEIEMKYIISPIIQACDAISGARPGARREIMESYLQRIKDLEHIALSQDGVEKAYAIQAGRELRVIVQSEKVDDKRADELSFKISNSIQEEMTYPGQIKVTVIRETRSVHIAK